MRAMSKRTTFAAGASCVLALVACGGEAKEPGTCPEGTVLHGADCLPGSDKPDKDPDEATSGSTRSTSSSDEPSEHPPKHTASSSSEHASSPPPGEIPAPPPGEKTAYDKDAVEAQLKRGARQVKAGCGGATDDNGEANGPWGKTTANITLGRNGHVKLATVPAPFDGTPVATCVARAFDKITFPPYAASADITIPWEVEIVRPHK